MLNLETFLSNVNPDIYRRLPHFAVEFEYFNLFLMKILYECSRNTVEQITSKVYV